METKTPKTCARLDCIESVEPDSEHCQWHLKDEDPAPVREPTPLISEDYRKQNELLHEQGGFDGLDALLHVHHIVKVFEETNSRSILDYGCGVGTLSKYLSLPVFNYDPCVPQFAAKRGRHDMIVCLDVLEHIEPESIDAVLVDIWNSMAKVGYLHIATAPDVGKTLPDGRNPHLIVEPAEWWNEKLLHLFGVIQHDEVVPYAATFTVTPKTCELGHVERFVDRVRPLG